MATARVAASELLARALAATAINGDPPYEEAMASPQGEQWKMAIREKCSSILRNDTFATTTGISTGVATDMRSPENKPIGSKWVFKAKTNPDESIRHKVRLVIKGYMQSDWGETYAPISKLTTFRYLASLAAGYGFAIDHMDIVTAFINPHVDDPELYMEIPKGWDNGNGCAGIRGNGGAGDIRGNGGAGNIRGNGGSGNSIRAGTIIRLNKALYGLKQAPRLWYKDIDTFLQSLSFTQSRADSNLYIYREGTTLVLLLLYIDDISMPIQAKQRQ